ncbi:hypothetical protein [Nocardia kruczakiae]|uniref:hypothetical protein n=1 Tax=Nocardia kruczakiae TaxID=261477 RepID=UPI000A4A76A9|nr:hypothetical protein [Nocardia kruczakiae]
MTRITTQPDDRTAPGPHQVVRGIHRLSAIMEINAPLDVLAPQGRVGHGNRATVLRFASAA